jgi:cation diffusion facilitator CzcD-associated flavoprotein CzcO
VRDYTSFNKHVDSAVFDEHRQQWLVECADGTEVYAKWFIPCIGFASKRYTPPFQGLGNFKGDIYHSAVWPQHGVNLKGKRVAEVGTGASGIQIIQEIGPVVKELTVYLRTPNLCLPMNQHMLDPKEEEEKKKNGWYEKQMEMTRDTFAGFTYDFMEKNTFDDTPEEREKVYHNLMVENGGFMFWLATYKDMLFDLDANKEAYNFWRKQVLKRLKNPEKQRLLAPEVPPHPWGTKRPSLEQRFYEVVDQDNVNIIDVNENPIEEVTATGIRTKQGLVEVDVIVLATGFDSVTGSLAQLNIQGVKGGTIADHWKNGTRTSMGIAMPEFRKFSSPMCWAASERCTNTTISQHVLPIRTSSTDSFQLGPQLHAISGRMGGEGVQANQREGHYEVGGYRGERRGLGPAHAREVECLSLSSGQELVSGIQHSWPEGRTSKLVSPDITGPLDLMLIGFRSGGMVEYVNTLNRSLENDFQGWKYATASA